MAVLLQNVVLRSCLHLFGQAAVLAAASFMLLAPVCAQTITVQGTKPVTVTIGGPTVYTGMEGNGILVKRGNGELDLTGITVRSFRGSMRLEAGKLLIEQDRNLGKPKAGLIFSGGTLSFLKPDKYIYGGFTVTMGSGRLITVVEGTFDTSSHVYVESALVGSGLLRKTGYGDLDFRNIKKNNKFTGTLRIENGSLWISKNRDLGGRGVVLKLAGGNMKIDSSVNVKLAKDRQIIVSEYTELGLGWLDFDADATLDIASKISTEGNGELHVSGNTRISGKSNKIDMISIRDGELMLYTYSLGEGNKEVIMYPGYNPKIAFDQKKDGGIKGWEFIAYSHDGSSKFAIVKRGDNRLTIENGSFEGKDRTFGNAVLGVTIEKGAIVSKGSNRGFARFRVDGGATLEFEVNEGKATVFYDTYGDGKLLKTGEGLLEMYGQFHEPAYTYGGYFDYKARNSIAHIEVREGTVSIEEDRNLGAANARLNFTGGTLRFVGMSVTITMGPGRLITVATEGTFDTRADVDVRSTLAGSGLLRKTGSGDLDFRNIKKNNKFTGTLRIENGSLWISKNRDLGGRGVVLKLAGGNMKIDSSVNVKLAKDRQIIVSEYTELGLGWLDFDADATLDIASKISTEGNGELHVSGNTRISGKSNKIDMISIRDGELMLYTYSLGEGNKEVIMYADRNPKIVFDQEEHGGIKGWEFIAYSYDYGYSEIVKRGDNTLTIENSSFEGKDRTSGDAVLGVTIEKGAIVSKGSNRGFAHFRVDGGATLEFEVNEGKATVFYNTYGDGKLLKTGEGLLEMYGQFHEPAYTYGGYFDYKARNSIAHVEIQEGVAAIEEDGNLGAADARLNFTGGTLRFVGMSVTITMGSGRLIDVGNDGGTFDTRADVDVHSTLAGSGELRKIGDGMLDFRRVRAGSFEGNLRIEQGCLRLGDGTDLGKGGLIFSGGNICGAAPPALTLSISVASGTQVTLAVVTLKASVFTTMPDSTVQMDFQGDNARLLLTIGAERATIEAEHPILHNVVFNGRSNSVIEKKGGRLLFMDEGVYSNPNGSATIRIERGGLSMRHRTSRLSLGWGVDIVAPSAKLRLSLAAITTHIGPRSLAGRGGFIKLGEGNLDMTRTDFDNFHGSFTVEKGRVDTESLSEDSRIAVDALGALQLSLAITISHPGPRSLSGSGRFMKLGEGNLDMFRTDSRGFNGLLAIEGGRVDTGPLGEGSSITIGGQGAMRMFLANLVQTIAVTTVTQTAKAITVTQTSAGITVIQQTAKAITVIQKNPAMKVTQTSAGITVTQTVPAVTVPKTTIPAVTVPKTITAMTVPKTTTIQAIAISHTIAALTISISHPGPRSLSGSGKFVKLGEGVLDMFQTNGSGFTGMFDIKAGMVTIGSLGTVSKIDVQTGATLAGGGTVGTVAVHSGGIFYQGASSAALHIGGDYTQKDGTYRVRLGPQFKPVTVSGQASVSGYFELVTVSDADLTTDVYTILQAQGGVSGTLTSRSSIMFARESIIVSVNGVTAMRKGLKSPVYHQYAHGRNGAGVAWALTQVEVNQGRPASYALFYIQDADQARWALSSLSGQMHVSAAAAMMSSGGWIEDAAAGQMRLAFGKRAYGSQRALRVPVAAAGLAAGTNAGGGLGVWSKSLESEKRYGGSEDVRALSYSSSGSLLGFDLPAGAWRAGLFSGTSQAQFAQEGGEATGSNDSYHAGMYTGRMWGKTALRAGMSYSRHEIRMSRRLSLPGAENRLASDYKAHTFAFFGQFERLFVLAGVELEPFVGLSHVRHRTEEFVETGAAGLAIGSAEQEISASVASAGLAASGGFRLGALRMQARGMLAWKHGLGSGESAAQQSLGASERFEVYGAGGSEDSLELEAGLGVRLSEDAQMSLTYSELDLLDAGGRDGHVRARLELAL